MRKLTQIISILFYGLVIGQTVIVDQSGNGDAVTITEGIALSYSSNSDTVKVLPGTYIEQVTLGSRVLIGSGADVTQIYFNQTTVVAQSNGGYIEGFEIISVNENSISASKSITVKKCILRANGWGLSISNSAALITNNVFTAPDGGGTNGILARDNSQATAFNNIFYNANKAFEANNAPATHNIRNNIFLANSTAISSNNGSNVLSVYNIYNGNSANHSGNGAAAGLGELFSDPKFEDISKSFLLKSDSPTRDAGDPTSPYNDGDGSRNDMGIYGGPDSWGDGPVITDISISPTIINQGGTITIEATAKKN